MLFKNEKTFRDDIIKNLKKECYIRNIYKLENYSGSGLGDILIITENHNIIIELKVFRNTVSLLQQYNINSNKFYWLISYDFCKKNKEDKFCILNIDVNLFLKFNNVNNFYNTLKRKVKNA